MLLIHATKLPYSFDKDGKHYEGHTYKCVCLGDKGYEIFKLANEDLYKSAPLGTHCRLLFDQYKRITQFIEVLD